MNLYSYVFGMDQTTLYGIDILRKYVDQSLSNDDKISFFILNGPKNIGKSRAVQNLAQEILGQYAYSDFLYVRDFSDVLGKEHIIRVKTDENSENYKILFNEYQYKDLGTRDILDWIYKSPAGKNKILLIENIERMNNESFSAFLKTCEDVLPNRILIATTSNKGRILKTILSRAIVINTYGDFHDEFQKKYDLSVFSTDDVVNQYKLLMEIKNSGNVRQFIDSLIAYFIQQNNFTKAQQFLNVKKYQNVNVTLDNLLLSLLL